MGTDNDASHRAAIERILALFRAFEYKAVTLLVAFCSAIWVTTLVAIVRGAGAGVAGAFGIGICNLAISAFVLWKLHSSHNPQHSQGYDTSHRIDPEPDGIVTHEQDVISEEIALLSLESDNEWPTDHEVDLNLTIDPEVLRHLDLDFEQIDEPDGVHDLPDIFEADEVEEDAPAPSLTEAMREGKILFAIKPVHTLPHRKIGICEGSLLIEGKLSETSDLEMDEVKLAHAIAHLTSAPDQPVMIEINPETLENDEFLDGLNAIYSRAAGVNEKLVFELPESVFACPRPALKSLISTLSAKGFQFASTKQDPFVIADFIALQDHWKAFSYLKMSASNILEADEDVLQLLAPLSIQIIATNLNSDADAAEMIDRSVVFASGDLFALASKAA